MLTFTLFVLFFSLYSYLYTEYADIQKHQKAHSLTVRELKLSLKANGCKGYSHLKKPELIEFYLQNI